MVFLLNMSGHFQQLFSNKGCAPITMRSKNVVVITPNGVEVKQISNDNLLEDLQDIVGGNIQLLPHPDGMAAPYVAYANEEGLLLNLPPNELATRSIARLGFMDFKENWNRCIAGNVVILGKDEKSLTSKQQSTIVSGIK